MSIATEKVIFPWRPAYSVGIPQIDSEHQGLVKLINDFYLAMMERKAKEVLTRVIDELIVYTERHFKNEESMLASKRYARLAEHSAVHKKLTGEVYELRDHVRSGEITATIEVSKFLKDWLANHIMTH